MKNNASDDIFSKPGNACSCLPSFLKAANEAVVPPLSAKFSPNVNNPLTLRVTLLGPVTVKLLY